MFSCFFNKIIKSIQPEKDLFHSSYEMLHSEANNVSAGLFLFSGLRAQIGKTLNRFCYLQQGFIVDGITQPSTYNLGGVISTGKEQCHISFEPSSQIFNAKLQVEPLPRIYLKAQTQGNLDGSQKYFQLEAEYVGSHSNMSAKIINPKIKNKEGVFVGNFIKKITKRFSIGSEFVVQREKEVEDDRKKNITRMGHGMSVKCSSKDSRSVFCLTVQNFSGISSSYYHRLTDETELSTELHATFSEYKKEVICSTSVKTVHDSTTIRSMLDTTGRLGVFLEEKLFNGVCLFLSGELSGFNSIGKAGIGVSIEN